MKGLLVHSREGALKFHVYCNKLYRTWIILLIGLATVMYVRPAALLAEKAPKGFIPPAAKVPPAREWFDQLKKPGRPIVYKGDQLQNLTFPLGGIGTGSVWLHGSGRLVNWQIFNNIQRDSQVDDTFFAIRIQEEGKQPIIRVLQQEDIGPFRGIADIQFRGDYPIATLTFRDPDLPIDIELEAYNPLIPHNEKDSGIPCAIFTVRANNKTNKPVQVSFLVSVQNAVNHAMRGSSVGMSHLTYGGNVNRILSNDALTAISMSAVPGHIARIEPPIALFTDHDQLPAIHESLVAGLRRIGPGVEPADRAERRVYWLATGDLRRIGGSMLSEIVQQVREHGSLLVLENSSNPLSHKIGPNTAEKIDRREQVFADFDGLTYGDWRRKGKGFKSDRPASGSIGSQDPVTGFVGAGLANSYYQQDAKRGYLYSPEFAIDHKYISFLIGGAEHLRTCHVSLKIDNHIVLKATGKNSEHLERVEWDVPQWRGRKAMIQIFDERKKKWGHILADDIRFSDLSIDAITVDDAKAWNAMIDAADSAAVGTPARIGRGQVVRLAGKLSDIPETDRIHYRNAALSRIAQWLDVTYAPALSRPAEAPSFGTMALATSEPNVSIRTGWTDRNELYERFSQQGRLEPIDDTTLSVGPSEATQTINAALCVEASAPAQASAQAAFLLTWHFPNQYYPHNEWRPFEDPTVFVGTQYANWFNDAIDVARYASAHRDRLRERTFTYRDAIFDTSLPQYFIDAVAANVSILRSPTCFWAKDGVFYGYEGVWIDGDGSCPMNCNHVWGYEHTLAWLWPMLERNMRETALKYHLRADGAIHHRVEVPRDKPEKTEDPVADGQCLDILKVYREHRMSPDGSFLAEYWPATKKAMDFAIVHWDTDRDGIMDQPQHNTHDWVIEGQNTFVSSQYLAALRAAEEMAKLQSDFDAARRYRNLFEKGKHNIAETLYNGEYYIHKSDNLQYGYGMGCWSEQVMGQWWARILNLGDILPNDQVQSALRAVFKYNWLWTHQGFNGTERCLQFADGTDKGLLAGSWPHGGRPKPPMLHRDEVWTGIEYMIASHKIYEGQLDEALAVVKGARERYDGTKRSPFNEIEAGDSYVRAMSSWSLLLAAQGYDCDGPNAYLAFDPKLSSDDHRSFFSVPQGWGRFEQQRYPQQQTDRLTVLGGQCKLKQLRLGLPEISKTKTPDRCTVRLNDRDLVADVAYEQASVLITLNAPVAIQAGEMITVMLEWK